jgi:hypothetical protein
MAMGNVSRAEIRKLRAPAPGLIADVQTRAGRNGFMHA